MGILIFTFLAVALGCGMGSKARKDRKQREKRLQQGSIPADKPLFRPADRSFEPARPPFGPEEIPFGAEETHPDPFWEVPEESLETMEPEQDALPDPETLPEEVLPETPPNRKAAPTPPTGKSGFSLREAVIAQTVLERKYR